MKKHLVFILASLIVFVVVMVYLWCENHKPIITKELVTIQANGACPTNNRQYQASVWLGVYDGKLYFYPHCGTVLDRTSYDGFLCVFENGGATKLADLKKVTAADKPALIGEIGTIPSADALEEESSQWISYMTWCGDFCLTENFTSDAELNRMYHHPRAVTLDRLPALY